MGLINQATEGAIIKTVGAVCTAGVFCGILYFIINLCNKIMSKALYNIWRAYQSYEPY